jgi:hypothetical protein
VTHNDEQAGASDHDRLVHPDLDDDQADDGGGEDTAEGRQAIEPCSGKDCLVAGHDVPGCEYFRMPLMLEKGAT